jgi:hypothetical protein
MKYCKPTPVKPTVMTRRFVDIRRLTPEMAALFWCVVGVLVGSLLYGGSYLLGSAVAADRAADVKDAPLQTGTAVVEVKNMLYAQRLTTADKVRVKFGFRIHGHLVSQTQYDDDRSAHTHVGDHVDVQYRVGKNGDIYLEDWQPPHP